MVFVVIAILFITFDRFYQHNKFPLQILVDPDS